MSLKYRFYAWLLASLSLPLAAPFSATAQGLAPVEEVAPLPNEAPLPGEAPIPIDINRLGQDMRQTLARGQAQLQNEDIGAITTLRRAAQSALGSLSEFTRLDALKVGIAALPDDVATRQLAQNAAQAHLLWGLAADHFARRDEAITALSRAVRLSRAVIYPSETLLVLQRDASQSLSQVLREGLPLVAPDDALDTIASIAHGGFWKPKRFHLDTPLPGMKAGEDFLLTDGKVFPPVATENGSLTRVPDLYRDVASDRLPAALQLDKMIAGYRREVSGPNKGQWRQIVRVFYASSLLTQGSRNDLPRAKTLCAQFLKAHALFERQLAATNLYALGDKMQGVTTLWLLEVSALWPFEEDNIAARQTGALPASDVSIGLQGSASPATGTQVMRPWTPVAGQSESAPGEILFWKAALNRPESEWLREIFHEYGHVALPPLGGFRAPLETYGNGMMGETLGALWMASAPEGFENGPEQNSLGNTASSGEISEDFAGYVSSQIVPALKSFHEAGPLSPLRASTSREGWRYLQGLTVYLERVYGARLLGRACSPLSQRAASVSNIAARRSLMNTQTLLNSLDLNWRDPWSGTNFLPIWLPGACNLPWSAAELGGRREVALKAGRNVQITLYVPPGAASLRIEGAPGLQVVGFPFVAQDGATRLFFGSRSGWQTFSLRATSDTKISAARFEKK